MSELYHYGIKGMHWGVRRFQNADGSLTSAGRARYNTGKNLRGALDDDRSISGRIRNKQYSNAQKTLSDSKQALRELNDIERNASKSKIASSRVSTAIRNKQIEKAKRDIADSKEAISELRAISKHKQQRKLDGAQKAFDKNVNKNWAKSYNRATDQFNQDIKKLNAKYKGQDLGWDGRKFTTSAGKKYAQEAGAHWQRLYSNALISDFGSSPKTGKRWINNMPMMNMYSDIYDKD